MTNKLATEQADKVLRVLEQTASGGEMGSGCFRIEPLQAIAYEHDDDHYDTFEEAVAAAKEKLPRYDDAYGIYSYCGGEHAELIAVVSHDFRDENIDEPQVFLKRRMNSTPRSLLYRWLQVADAVIIGVMADNKWGCMLCFAEHTPMYESFIHSDNCLASQTEDYYMGDCDNA